MVKIEKTDPNKLTITKDDRKSLTVNVNDMIYFEKKSKGGFSIQLYGIIKRINFTPPSIFAPAIFAINIIVFSPKYYNSVENINQLDILNSFEVIPLEQKNNVYAILMEECVSEINRYRGFANTKVISKNEADRNIQKYTTIYYNFKELLSQGTQGITYQGGKIKKPPTKKPPAKKPPTKKPPAKKPPTKKPPTKKPPTKKPPTKKPPTKKLPVKK